MTPSLRPVAGTPQQVLDLIAPWTRDGGEPIVVRTSGSTGEPKDVVLSHAAMIASATATHARLGGPGGWLQAMPVTGVGGLQVLIRSTLAGVRPAFVDEHESLADAIAAIEGPRRYASLVPTQVYRLLGEHGPSVFDGLDALLIGGAATPPDLLERLRGVPVVRTYGMTETCGGCVYDGVPLDGVQIAFDDAGQVLVRGAVLFDGYRDAERTRQVMRDGWLLTNDLGHLEDGRLVITGRADDVVISGGVNVALPAVTQALRQLDGVTDAIALGVDDVEWGSRVVGFVVADGAREWTVGALRDALEADGLTRTWAPRQLVHVDHLPLLPGGKVDRQRLRALAEQV